VAGEHEHRSCIPGSSALTLPWGTGIIDAMQTPPDTVVAQEVRHNLAGQPQLLQLRSDRRLGHEWDDWDGQPLPGGGNFHAAPALFFQLAALGAVLVALGGLALLWLLAPRLGALWLPLPTLLLAAIGVGVALVAVWLGLVASAVRTGRNLLPERLAERGLVPWMMPRLESLGVRLGHSRDRVGNALMRVYNGLAVARARPGVTPDELLVLLPRCLSKAAMQSAMEISGRYGVPLFVASRGRYARQMIGMRRPRRVVAVACERDLVSGVADVGGRLPVLGTTLTLPDGPCKNTEMPVAELEAQIRSFLGLEPIAAAGR
jgi:uncharacterized protein